MAEEVLEAELIAEEEAEAVVGDEPAPRPLPARSSGGEISLWRGEMRTAAIAAAGGLVAGAATVAAVRATKPSKPSRGSGRKLRRSREKQPGVLASRSFLVDVHLLDR